MAPTYSNRVGSGLCKSSVDIVALALIQRSSGFSWAKSGMSSPAPPIEFYWGAYADPTDVHVGYAFDGGGGVQGRMRIGNVGEPPLRFLRTSYVTGRIEPMAVYEGKPDHVCWILFLARSDVSFGRNRLWHLRKHLVEAMPAPWGGILSRGRCGRFDSSGPSSTAT